MNKPDRIAKLRSIIEQWRGRKQQIEHSMGKASKEIKIKSRLIDRHVRAIEIVKYVGLETQKRLEYHLSEHVSLALASVFDDPYELVVRFQEKRGKTEAEILFARRGFEIRPVGAVGGGAIDVAALALRISYLTMRQDRRFQACLFFDEPFSRLKGTDANKRALALLQRISSELQIQIIIISDERIPREDIFENADRVFLVTQKTGISLVKQLTK